MEAKETSAVLYHSSVLACEGGAVMQDRPAWVWAEGSSSSGGSAISVRLLLSFASAWTEASHLCSWRWRNGFLYPVLKHGPRSLTYVRVYEWQTHMRNESNSGWTFWAQSAGHNPSGERSECEHTCWDPKDGELCLNRVKPRETTVEARSGSDVQIDRQIWV